MQLIPIFEYASFSFGIPPQPPSCCTFHLGCHVVFLPSPQALSHAERIDVARGLIGIVRVAVVPCFGAEARSKRPFKAFMRSRIVRRPIFEERLPVPAGGGPCEPVRSKPLSSCTTI